jgi:hypothetical protein
LEGDWLLKIQHKKLDIFDTITNGKDITGNTFMMSKLETFQELVWDPIDKKMFLVSWNCFVWFTNLGQWKTSTLEVFGRIVTISRKRKFGWWA